uniref:Cadherin domain-containing protein n=1 Tax=Heterorhabditis bacteriophora TaxID=37862 RepID=A0A1I7XR14_HETBA
MQLDSYVLVLKTLTITKHNLHRPNASLFFSISPHPHVPEFSFGRVAAYDADGPGFNDIYYYFLSTCSPETVFFLIDKEYGELTYIEKNSKIRERRIEICVLASGSPDIDPSNVIFDARNASMIRIVVQVMVDQPIPQLRMSVENNTVTLIGDHLMNINVPISKISDPMQRVRYSLKEVEFTPAQHAAMVSSSTDSLFLVDHMSGDVRVSPTLVSQPQGVYRTTIEAFVADIKKPLAFFIKEFHYVKNEMKTKYMLNMSPDEFGKNEDQFERTSVCFHLTMNGTVLDDKSALAALSQSIAEDTELSKLYHVYKIINIERCTPASDSSIHQSALYLPSNVVAMIAVVAILILILITLFIYVCFVTRYRDHLQAKEREMKVCENKQILIFTANKEFPGSYSYDVTPTFVLPAVITAEFCITMGTSAYVLITITSSLDYGDFLELLISYSKLMPVNETITYQFNFGDNEPNVITSDNLEKDLEEWISDSAFMKKMWNLSKVSNTLEESPITAIHSIFHRIGTENQQLDKVIMKKQVVLLTDYTPLSIILIMNNDTHVNEQKLGLFHQMNTSNIEDTANFPVYSVAEVMENSLLSKEFQKNLNFSQLKYYYGFDL